MHYNHNVMKEIGRPLSIRTHACTHTHAHTHTYGQCGSASLSTQSEHRQDTTTVWQGVGISLAAPIRSSSGHTCCYKNTSHHARRSIPATTATHKHISVNHTGGCSRVGSVLAFCDPMLHCTYSCSPESASGTAPKLTTQQEGGHSTNTN